MKSPSASIRRAPEPIRSLPAGKAEELRRFISAGPLHRGAILTCVAAAAGRLPAGSRVLDAGAGNAPYRELFSHCVYRTQEWSASPHTGAQQADIIGDLHDLPVQADTFDFILCTEVLEHLHDPRRALGEMRRVLRPDGELLLTVPFVHELHEEPYDFYRYTPYALRRLLEEAGLRPLSIQPLSGWWSTLAHVLRHCGKATCPAEGPSSVATRGAAFAMRQLSRHLARMAPTIDRLDQRRGLPIGWACTATVRERCPTLTPATEDLSHSRSPRLDLIDPNEVGEECSAQWSAPAFGRPTPMASSTGVPKGRQQEEDGVRGRS